MERRAAYHRERAVAYALRHWNDPNPRFANMDASGAGGDCTNFTSQALLAGGWPMDFRGTGYDREWWYRRRGDDPFDAAADDWWSCTWSLPENQFQYLSLNHAETVDLRRSPEQARRLRLGDLVFYDWDGDGRLDHGSIVTAFDRFGRPLVTYRTLSPRPPVRNAHWELPFRGPARRIVAALLPDAPRVFPAAPDWSRLIPCETRRRGR